MSYGVAKSELLREGNCAEAVQEAMSYKFRTRLDVSKEVTGNG